MKKRHVRAQPLPLQRADSKEEGQNSCDQGHQKKASPPKKLILILRFVLSVVIISVFLGTFATFFQPLPDSGKLLYGSPSNATNEFVAEFEDALLSDLHRSQQKGGTRGHGFFVPLILENGKLLCRRDHKRQMSWFRLRTFVQMVRRGLLSKSMQPFIDNIDGALPIFIIEGDNIGCNVAMRHDYFLYPRLAWSIPSPNHGNFCHAVGMPSYETWIYHHHRYKEEEDWTHTFQKYQTLYPWSSKINKAVWRGTSTYEVSQYGESQFSDIPRAKLVKKSMEHPDLIDAGFTQINQMFEPNKRELARETIVTWPLRFKDMMKYKAIIDIDGNNWSSRFAPLLCMNSVVIKIEPDFIEYFYDNLKPMEHYVPATLENVTDAVAYVIDKKNEIEMKAIVASANSWCRKTVIEKTFIEDAMIQLDTYRKALDTLDNSWRDEWYHVKRRFSSSVDDLVDCDVKNYFYSLLEWLNSKTF